ncbi:MAG: type II toxin-antitoxin system Phd/YefM family antitoxin [Nitrospiraceae bacterium]|jgi:prevent-host-death family protein|nr:type II toxin-antitoxin system Phd/YefM family antitoxin [Nitrospiraceae bacterium]
MKTMTALDLRKKLGSVLNDVSLRKEQVVISRANKPLAVMISIDEYEEKVLKKNREKKLQELAAKMDEWRKKHKKRAVSVDVVKAIRETREGR